MKVIQIQRTGGPEELQWVDLPDPLAGPADAVVRAEAIGVGKPDVMIRTGVYPWMPPLPAIPGNEMVGVVESLGPEARGGLQVGQRVLVSARELASRGGCYAERIRVPADALFVLPPGLDPLAAVSMGNYQLALGMLFDSGSATPRSVLVQAAAGGVGIALVQTAAAHGIQVIAVAGTEAKCSYVREAGAHHVHRRGSSDLREAVLAATAGRGVDMVFDHVGGAGFVGQLDLLAARGTLLSYNVLQGIPPENLVAEMRKRLDRSVAVRCYSVHVLDHDRARRRELMQGAIDLLAQGRIRPPAPRTFALRDAQDAHRLLDSADLMGKIVLVP
ncbi:MULTISPECIES: zinc-dependent alcohol dehydrogenase family protein [Ramlibacter]|uniref:Zinc-binding dehydrogenase n=1 Tax=Ramlibacter pinisoli TaxID=2682844 RepID=A0A6N8IVI6_9BURK|nr:MULTISPECIES: zinc-dependent alcohol dehydrogenase family protein [Ramlibacter]MBA2964998.1 zinc-dependent alcohol dehydrogenase family protein [Ramlibacter sp. CGMCC 1.13660]MVQ29963.1 zinc-binding dehydrogenase [Ramlibacter pinisoli]